ncbi:hypothetical protein I317_02673 [Kwoniella heveanensis CBS 569]|nr:hypothetical protein I317_02673 [Kwoniella heveanensis CBS 569]
MVWLQRSSRVADRANGCGAGPSSGSEYELLPRQELIDGHDGGDESVTEPATPPDLPGPRPTSAQLRTLRRIPGNVPWTAYTIAIVELAERASYYGVGGLFPNFVQRPLPAGGPGTGAPPPGSQLTPGALGMGLQVSTALSVIFSLLAYTTPLLGGILADLRWGKFKTIAVGTGIAGVAHVLSVYAALPSLLQSGTAFLPFLAGLLLLGGSAGLIKANIATIMAEQYTPTEDYVAILPNGERVIVEREASIQKIMSAYYGSINVGAFIAITSTFAEKYVGFWLAFLIPGVIFMIMPFLLRLVYPYLVPSPPPSSSALIDAYDEARLLISNSNAPTKWSEVDQIDQIGKQDDLGRIVQACKFFSFFVIYNIADGGLNALVTSLAGSMTTNVRTFQQTG